MLYLLPSRQEKLIDLKYLDALHSKLGDIVVIIVVVSGSMVGVVSGSVAGLLTVVVLVYLVGRVFVGH